MRWLSFLLAPLAWVFLLTTLFKKKHRQTFCRRLGRGFPKKLPPSLVWIHAVSVGETLAVVPLAKKLQKQGMWILFSSVTVTGHETAKKELSSGTTHVFLPFDLPFLITRLVKRAKPQLVIISETDLWPNFLHACKKQGAKVVLVNGKISSRSWRRFRSFSFLARSVLNPIDHLCVQGSLYARRFETLGVVRQKMTVTGNLKLCRTPAPMSDKQKKNLCQTLGIKKDDFVLTLGSTHAPEEKLFLDLAPSLFNQYPHLKLLIVPRHPERFEAVKALMKSTHIAFGCYSAPNASAKIILIDAMGLLSSCYALSDLAFVGGSLTPHVGGHNIAEPAFFKVPVCFGPYMSAQPDLVKLFVSKGGARQLSELTLSATLNELIHSKTIRDQLVAHATSALTHCKKGLEHTYEKIIAQKAL